MFEVGMTFYSSVILNSTETNLQDLTVQLKFYSSVILNSTETMSFMRLLH